jgi:hypothetical protein
VRSEIVGRLLLGVGVLGVVVSLLGGIVGARLVGTVDRGVGQSLALTGDALEALDASLVVAEDSVAIVSEGLGEVEGTARELEATLDQGGTLLSEGAELAGNDLADSLEAVEASMPALVRVAATIDGTLRAVDRLPFTQPYEPEQPFDQSVRDLQAGLEGVPESLREQAALLAGAGESLESLGGGVVAIADTVQASRVELEEALRLLDRYSRTATEARTVLAATQEDLARQTALARVLVWALAGTIALGQLAPLFLGRELAAGRRLVRDRQDTPTR